MACLFLQACHRRSREKLHIDGLQRPGTCSSYPPFLGDPERTFRRIAFISGAGAVLIQLVLALLFSGEYCCTDAPPNHVFKECYACMFVYTLSLYIHVVGAGVVSNQPHGVLL